jgi:hypothetical protein
LSQPSPPPSKGSFSKRNKILIVTLVLVLLLVSVLTASYLGFLGFPSNTGLSSTETAPDISSVQITQKTSRWYTQQDGPGWDSMGKPIDSYGIYVLVDLTIKNPTAQIVLIEVKGQANITISLRVRENNYSKWDGSPEITKDFTIPPHSNSTYTMALFSITRNTDYPNTIEVQISQLVVKELYKQVTS